MTRNPRLNKHLDIFTDGACSGNPGLAAIGVVLKDGDRVIWELSQTIGTATNNIAEYTALIYGLQEALIRRAQRVVVYTDSELMHRQFAGQYKVKNPNIKPLFDQVRHLTRGFKDLEIRHIPRGQNSIADGLAKKAIKQEQAKTVASGSFPGEESPGSKG